MGVKRAEDILFKPATEEEIVAVEERYGRLPADFKEMVRVANGFIGGYHFLSGGISGIQDISDAGDDGLMEHAHDFSHKGMRQDGLVVETMLSLQPGTECDCFRHYIIAPDVWRQNIVGREVVEGEYQFWYWAPWQACINKYDSVRDWVAKEVEEIEAMVEKGEMVQHNEDEFDGEDDSEVNENNGRAKKSSNNDGDAKIVQEERAEVAGNDGKTEDIKRKNVESVDDWEIVDALPDEEATNGA